jgi:hypothetical protein
MEVHADDSQEKAPNDEDDDGDDEDNVAISTPNVFADVKLAKTAGECDPVKYEVHSPM